MKKTTTKTTELEDLMEYQIKEAKLPKITREHKFHPERKWRFDLAFLRKKVAVECEGGTWTRGRHIHPIGFEKDCEKYNEALIAGWKVMRFTGAMIRDGRAIEQLTRLIK